MNLNGPERNRDLPKEHAPDLLNTAAAMRKQDQMQNFGLSWDASAVSFPKSEEPNTKRAIWRAKKVFADIIHDVTALEGNPFTVPEIQTLLDGITVGGRKVSDAEQVLHQQAAFLHLFDLVESGKFSLSCEVACGLQGIAARGEALEEGVFRNGVVSIAGTTYKPPGGKGETFQSSLEKGFLRMAAGTERLGNPFEEGMVAFLHVARAQCFWDGNKRTGRLLMNGVLLTAGQDIITVPADRQLEYNQKMISFYESGEGTEMMNFLSELQIRSRFE